MMVGHSSAMQHVYKLIAARSRTPDATVLIRRRSGYTGKELVVNAIHFNKAGGARDLLVKSQLRCDSLKLCWNRSYLDTRRALLRTLPFDASDALEEAMVEHLFLDEN